MTLVDTFILLVVYTSGMNQINKIETATKMGYVYECELCGTIGQKGNSQSKCDWSFLGNHSWKLIKAE